MGVKIFQAILLPWKGKPEIINLSLKDIDSCLQCKCTNGLAINYLEYFGYQTTMFCIDKESQDVSQPNVLASLIIKERGPIYGPILILDDGKDLIIEDLRKIVEIAKEIPSLRWVPNPILDRMLADPSESPVINNVIKDMKKASGTDEQRKSIWEKIGKYYVPGNYDED